MPNPTPKGDRIAIVVRLPVDLIAKIAAALPTLSAPDRNSLIVEAIEKELKNAPG